MSSEYSRVVAFYGSSAAVTSLELPAFTNGSLERVIIIQTNPSVAVGSGSFKIYDRKAACIGLTDLNVKASGTVSSVSTSSTGVITLVSNISHNLGIADTFFIKDCADPAYNLDYQVTAINSNTSVTISPVGGTPANSSTASSGVWQTYPFDARTSPATNLIYSGTITAGVTFQQFSLGRAYENKDNQDINLRCRHTGLWLEFTPATLSPVATLNWEIAYTCKKNNVD